MIKTLSLSALALATMGFNSAAHADIADFDSPRIYTINFSFTVNIAYFIKVLISKF